MESEAMTNFDNKLNINQSRQAYVPNLKKEEPETKAVDKHETEVSEANEKALQQGEMFGRILVSSANKPLCPETVQCVKDAVEFFQNNPSLASAAVRTCDDACELGASYEKACCGALDAAYLKDSSDKK